MPHRTMLRLFGSSETNRPRCHAFARRIAGLVIAVSALLWVAISVCYWGRFDGCTAATVYPPWFWTAIGMLLSILIARMGRKRWAASLGGLWIAYLLVFADSPLSLVRGCLPQPDTKGALRVVTFNCASDPSAAREVIPLNPDIVLFQETASRDALEKVAEELFGDGATTHWSPDASIISRFELQVVDVAPNHRENFVHVQAQLNDGQWLDVVSLRLFPSPLRMDLWNPRCWQVYADNRRKRRRQMETIVAHLDTIAADRRMIVGGDFNAPPGDAVFRLFRPRFADAFETAGRGWGRSFMSGVPILRIDQLWYSQQLQPVQVFSVSSSHSDHSMVVGDFQP